MDKKVCYRCNIEKDLDKFYRNKSAKDGFQPSCKKCIEKQRSEALQKRKEYFKNNPEERYATKTKICTGCKIEKTNSEFYTDNFTKDGFDYRCKTCHAEYREEKREHIRDYKRSYRDNNRGKIREQNARSKKKSRTEDREKFNSKQRKQWRSYYKRNRHDIIKKQSKRTSAYMKRRKQKDPSYKLKCDVSSRIKTALKKSGGKKNCSTFKKLPYTPEELKNHLQNQFEPWMNWGNHGKISITPKQTWNIDHIIPQSKLPYDSMDHPNFQKCWVLENLRPLDSYYNVRKKDKTIYKTVENMEKYKIMLSMQIGNIDEMSEISIYNAIDRSGLEFKKDFDIAFTCWNTSHKTYKWLRENNFMYRIIPFDKNKGFLFNLYRGWSNCYSYGLEFAPYVVVSASDHMYYHNWLKNLLQHSEPDRIVNCKLIEKGHIPSLHTTRDFGDVGKSFKLKEFDNFASRIQENYKNNPLFTNEAAYGRKMDAMPFSLPRSVWEKFGPMRTDIDENGCTGDTNFFNRCRNGGVEIAKSLTAISMHIGGVESTQKKKDGEY